MAIVIASVTADSAANLKVFTVAATANADVTATIAHGLGEEPGSVNLVNLLIVAPAANWILSSKNTTNVVLVKVSILASSNAAAQLRVEINRPHSIAA